MSTAQQLQPPDEHRHPKPILVTVSYLPASHPYHHTFSPETVVETVRTDAMTFFGVHDRQERDTYRYFLELGGVRIIDTNQTLEHLASEHHHEEELHFNLVEEITPGEE